MRTIARAHYLNVHKSNYVIFLPPQKYLGIILDSHLSWKSQVTYITKQNKTKQNKNYWYIIQNSILCQSNPFLIYGIVAWGNTYISAINPIVILQKRAIRIITFSNYNDRTNPLFKLLGIITFSDLVFLLNVIFVYDFTSGNLPPAFDDLFASLQKAQL